jgi:hypothetical protein
MNLDLNDLLRDWPHEAGQIRVRKIIGNDGREKLQLRIDLGLIQMEMTGRPDGQRPHGCESLLAYHQARAAAAEQEGRSYMLDADACSELQQEGVQYNHRYISLFQLNDFKGVIRDTQRNLELFSFVAEHVEREELAWSFEQFRPYVLMMNTRARASIELEDDNFHAAVKTIEEGRDRILEFYSESNNPELSGKSPEVAFLEEWLDEVRSKRPLSKLESLQREMERAIANEAYERAAELRDAIKAFPPRADAD